MAAPPPPNIPPLGPPPHYSLPPLPTLVMDGNGNIFTPDAAGQNHDRTAHFINAPRPVPSNAPGTTGPREPLPPPPPPPPLSLMDGLSQQESRRNDSRHGGREGPDDGSESEHEESEDEEDGGYGSRWHPIQEDKSAPCDDELAYITSKEEHSALDFKYWENETFFQLDDPDVPHVDSGRIDWLVQGFNGTRENPNTETLMRSEIVTIGSYDWRIKFYPRGNNTDYLSVYVENVTMQLPDFPEFEDFAFPSFPVLTGQKRLRKPRSIAVQLSIVMYNPGEPRTYEYQTDAHRFSKNSPDFGWTRFTRYSRRDFYLRNHGQRQAILRDDKLAFSAYIRVVQDPTGCLWEHGTYPFEDSIAMTGLRPWSPQHPQFAAFLPLLHFAPFRSFIYNVKNDSNIVSWMQMLLWKMLSRTRSQSYGRFPHDVAQSDPIVWLQRAACYLQEETDASVINHLIGKFDEAKGTAVGTNRLKTKFKSSVQAALDSHPSLLDTPALLALELDRQEFDRDARQWNRLTNKIDIPNNINVPGKFYPTKYTLFAVSTHIGSLLSNTFNTYIRPNGPGGLWYAYTKDHVTCLTNKQALEKYMGPELGPTASKSKKNSHAGNSSRWRSGFHGPPSDEAEISHVVFYVRDDVAASAFRVPFEENWDVPDSAKRVQQPALDDIAESKQQATAVTNGVETPVVDEPGSPNPARQDAPPRPIVMRKPCSPISDGHASPKVWLCDTEGDIVMSEADDDDEEDDNGEDDVVSAAVATGDAGNTTSPLPETDPADLITVIKDGLGREYYQGQMYNNQYHGEGHLITMSGDEYTGTFRKGVPHGQGTMIYASSGDTYTGAWRCGEHHGHGTLTERRTGNIFAGGWRRGRKHGPFVLRGLVTNDDDAVCSICYARDLNTAFYDCGHVVACKSCANMLDTCPVCRKRVLGRVELFGVKVSVE